MPEDADAAHGVGDDGVAEQFTVRTQLVNELCVGGQKNVVRGAVGDLLAEDAGGGRYETHLRMEGGLEVGFEVGEIGGGGDGESGEIGL